MALALRPHPRLPLLALALLTLVALTPGHAAAAIDKRVNFQGRLTDATGVVVPDGTYNMEFKLHGHATNAGGAQGTCSGTCLWMETRTSANRVTVSRGQFAVQLGEVTSLNSFNFNQTDLYLSIRIGGTALAPTWDGEMTPRRRLAAAPTAIHADAATTATTATNSTQLNGQLASFYAVRNADNAFAASQTITGQAILPTSGTGGGVLIGGDVNLYRDSANLLRTGDSLTVDGALTVGGNLTCTTCVDTGDIANAAVTIDKVGTIPGGKLSGGAAHLVPNTTWYNISPGTAVEDTGGMIDPAPFLGVTGVRANTAGRYLVQGAFQWSANNAGWRYALLGLNGPNALVGEVKSAASSAGAPLAHNLSTITRLAAGDTIRLYGYQSSGGTLYTDPQYTGQWLAITWLGP